MPIGEQIIVLRTHDFEGLSTGLPLGSCEHSLADPVEGPGDEFEEQCLLRAEHAEDVRLRDPCLPGDRVSRRAVESVFGEFLRSEFENLSAPLIRCAMVINDQLVTSN